MLCVTLVCIYWTQLTHLFCFALEYKSSERLLFLVFSLFLQLCSKPFAPFLRRDWSGRAVVQHHRNSNLSDVGSRQNSCHQLLCHQQLSQRQKRISLLPQGDWSRQVVPCSHCSAVCPRLFSRLLRLC